MKFSKPAKSTDEQISLLRRRGMMIDNEARAGHYLKHLSYYRLRAYWMPFEKTSPIDGDHLFQDGTRFEDALSLYVFDRELRLLVMDAIERVEVSLRAGWAYHLAMNYGAHGYIDPNLYARPDRYAKAMNSLIDEIGRSKDTFIEHYRDKYDDPEMPPIWMTSEIISLGNLSKWIGNLKLRIDRKAISTPYGLDEKVLVSLVHHLTYIRNICAHHGRLWNKQFIVTMTIPHSPNLLRETMNTNADRKIYNTLVALVYLMKIIAPDSEWRQRVIDLMDSHKLAGGEAMGFPDNWRNLPFWNS